MEPIENQNNPVQVEAPQNPQPIVPVAHDPVVNQVIENGVGPNLQPDNGQAAQFAANHAVEVGHDWDMKSAEGMLDTAQKAVRYIKDKVAAARSFDDYGRALSELSARVVGNDPANPSAGDTLHEPRPAGRPQGTRAHLQGGNRGCRGRRQARFPLSNRY